MENNYDISEIVLFDEFENEDYENDFIATSEEHSHYKGRKRKK